MQSVAGMFDFVHVVEKGRLQNGLVEIYWRFDPIHVLVGTGFLNILRRSAVTKQEFLPSVDECVVILTGPPRVPAKSRNAPD